MTDWLADHPDISTIRIAASDLNGIARGKRMPATMADKAIKGSLRFPLSVLNVDILGEDIEDSPLLFASGDPDGVLQPTERGFMPVPWLDTPTAILPVWMYHDDGSAFDGCPRQALARVVGQLAQRDLHPTVGTELEFYLVDDSGDELRSPPSPRTGKRRSGAQILSLGALDACDAFFTDLYVGAAAMGIPAEAAISESGPGQFEITLGHVSDALRAADDAWFFKILIRGLARKHGFAASFMAKPYADLAGTGFHTHISLLDGKGRNIFDNGGAEGTAALQHALAGCLNAMPGCGLIWAPHANSYDRLVPGAHAPTGVAWAYENRTVAVRVPGGSPKARRLEHRVAGGDTNPYLVLAAVLGAMLAGIEDAEPPPPPVTGNAYDLDLTGIPDNWEEATSRFARDPLVRRIFPRELVANLLATKRQEMSKLAEWSPEDLTNHYLDIV